MGLGEGGALKSLQNCLCAFIHPLVPGPFGAKMLAGCFLEVPFPPFLPTSSQGSLCNLGGLASLVSCLFTSLPITVGPGEASWAKPPFEL